MKINMNIFKKYMAKLVRSRGILHLKEKWEETILYSNRAASGANGLKFPIMLTIIKPIT